MHTVPTTPRRRRALGLATALLVLSPALGACGDAAESAAERLAEEAIEGAASDGVDVDIDGDKVTVEGSDGAYVAGGGLPEGFPSEDVPIVGEVTFGAQSAAGGSTGWTVATEHDGSPEEAFEEARTALEDAGFDAEPGLAGDTGTYASLASADHRVVLTAADAGNGRTSLSYVIAPATP